MNIGLDWDGTVTTNPAAWAAVVGTLTAAGYNVHIVTMRYQSEVDRDPEMQDFRKLVTEIHATGRQGKEAFMLKKNIVINIWIDDNPRAVHFSAEQIWGSHLPEGSTHTANMAMSPSGS